MPPQIGATEGCMTLIRSSRGRDLRVDFFRGLALWWIYTDHVPGDVLSKYSLQNFALCDAAEVFVPSEISTAPNPSSFARFMKTRQCS